MANDSMRTGPRGSSDQAAELRPITVQLGTYGGVTLEVDESVASAQFLGWTPLPVGDEAGYKVERIFIITTEAYNEPGENFTIGTFTKNADGSMAAVDDNAFQTVQLIANATAMGVTFIQTMNGAGAGLDPTTDANANFLIGGPSDHYLGLSTVATSSTGSGKFVCYADLVPVSGSSFSN
jgi:hypothetical protein